MDTGVTYHTNHYISNQKINTARIRDQSEKTDRENVCNSCCLTKDVSFQIGDRVLVRNVVSALLQNTTHKFYQRNFALTF